MRQCGAKRGKDLPYPRSGRARFCSASQLNPMKRGPLSGNPLGDGGTIRIIKDPFIIHVDAAHPGNAFIDATTATSGEYCGNRGALAKDC